MQEDLVLIVKNMIDVINDHDISAWLDFYADDAVVRLIPAPPEEDLTEEEDIIGWMEQNVNDNIHVYARDFQAIGDTVTWRSTLYLNSFASLGVETVEISNQAGFENGKIKFYVSEMDDKSVRQLHAAATSGRLVA